MKYLKQFIIGSSIPVFGWFYYIVAKFKSKNYKYFEYTLAAPIWFGVWNVISFILAEKYNLTIDQRFLLISIISSISIMILATISKSYNFTQNEWNRYYVFMFVKYMIVWNIIIKFLESNI
jgi:hypothetical protein